MSTIELHSAVAQSRSWPPLPLDDWKETLETVHMWTQIVGKVKLELAPFLNEWWQVALHLTARGLTTATIPFDAGGFTIDFDFTDHNLYVRTSEGAVKAMPLFPRSVADFYREFLATLKSLGIDVTINTLPVEIPNPIRFDEDHLHAAYDPEFVSRWWRILLQTEKVLQRYRSDFSGKSSPILFYWGSFDLSTTRFSGRPAEPPRGAPRFLQIAETQENFACGFWPGNVTMAGVLLGEPAFYAYNYPEPPGFRQASVQPAGAYFDPKLGEFILPYEKVRNDASPGEAILAFFRSTYEAAAELAHWDRAALEQPVPLDRLQPEGAHENA